MKTIKLTQGYAALVDDADYARCMQGETWYAKVLYFKDRTVRNVYASRSTWREGKAGHQDMHRFILGITDPAINIDHKDGSGLNNQRSNLRTASHGDNMHNSRKRKDNTSGFKGVHLHSQNNNWIASLMFEGRSKHLGCFATAKEAALAYDVAAKQLFGEFAKTNF